MSYLLLELELPDGADQLQDLLRLRLSLLLQLCLAWLLLSRCQLLAELRNLLLQGCALLQLALQLGVLLGKLQPLRRCLRLLGQRLRLLLQTLLWCEVLRLQLLCLHSSRDVQL